ncbi:MAG: C2 family cysteine protease [Myxococcota bacterium]
MYASALRTTLVLSLALTVACTNRNSDLSSYRPSMTMLRIGEVVVEEPPVIPEDNFIPGLVIAPEQFNYPDEQGGFRTAPDGWASLTDFGKMTAIEDPAVLEKHKDTYGYSLTPGSLIDENEERAITYEDVNQGAIANCYMVAALTGAIYADQTGAIKNGLIREVNDADGNLLHYSVRFYDAWGTPQDVDVDAELIRRSGKPLYARSADSRTDAEELWVGLVEKAYAKWHGSYDKIGNGGYTGDVFQAITGANASYKNLSSQSDESLFSSVVEAVNEGRPVASGTFGEDSGVDYTGTGVYAWHAYTVLGADRTEDGTYRIQLRNPWGSSEPADNGPDDGIFWLDFKDWRRLYSNVTIGGKFEADTTAPAQITDLTLAGIVEDRAVLQFTSTGDDSTSGLAYEYDVRMAPFPIDASNFYEASRVPAADPQAPNTQENLEITGLAPGVPMYVAIRVLDESGNGSPVSNVVEVKSESRPVYQGETFFEFENDADAWQPTGLFHLSTIDSTSGIHSFYMGQENTLNYDTGDRVFATLTSPAIDLTGRSSAELLWEQILDVEEGEYDAAWIEVSTNGFQTSETVWSKTSTTGTWRLELVDISAFAGQVIEIRFVFDSTDGVNNTGVGWLVDNVWIDGQ